MAYSLGDMVVKIVGDNSDFNRAIDKSQKDFLSLSQIISKSSIDIAKSFKQIEGEAAVWGNSTDLIKQKQEVLKNEISNLIAQGVDPLSTRIEKLQNEYYKLGNEAIALEKKQTTLNEKLTSFASTTKTVGTALTLGVTTPLVALATASFKSSAEMENLTTSFQIMLGSADKAQKLMADVIKMAAITPFTSPQLADATKMLLQYGTSVEEVLPLISRLGDISAGNGDKFNRLSYAFAQMSALGRVTGQDLRQMVEAGFNPLKVISDKTGESMASLQDRMSKGKLGIDEMKNALVIATSEGGKFFKGMEYGSKTFTGLLSTLQDNLGIAGRSITDDFLPVLKNIVIGASDIALKFSQLNPPIKTFIVTLTGLAAIAGPVALGIGAISKAFVALKTTNPEILIITASIVALGVGLATLASISKEAADKTNNLSDALSGQADLIRSNKALDDTIDKIKKLKAAMAVEGFNSRGNAEQRKQLEFLESQQALIQSNIDTLNRQRAAQKTVTETTKDSAKEASAWEQDRTKATKDYEEKIRKINLQVKEGLKTEDEGKEARKDALGEYIDDLNTIIAKYSLVEGTTTQLVDKQIALFNAMKNGNEPLKTRAQLLGEYSTADQMVTDIVIADQEREKTEANKRLIERAKAEQNFYKFRESVASTSNKKITKEFSESFSAQLSIINNFVTKINSIYNGFAQNQLNRIKAETDTQFKANDEQLQSALEAAGLEEKTAVESAQIKLDEAIKSNNVIEIADAQNALKKAQIEQEYNDKKLAIQKESAIKSHDIEVKQFNANKAFSLIQVAIDTASAIVKFLVDPGGLAGAGLSIAAGITGAAQAAVIAAQQPPVLALAEGGIIPPRIGGVNATLAEGGKTEVVFPLDKLENFLSNRSMNRISNNGNDMINLTVELDSEPIFSKIFQATKDKRILISAKSVV